MFHMLNTVTMTKMGLTTQENARYGLPPKDPKFFFFKVQANINNFLVVRLFDLPF